MVNNFTWLREERTSKELGLVGTIKLGEPAGG